MCALHIITFTSLLEIKINVLFVHLFLDISVTVCLSLEFMMQVQSRLRPPVKFMKFVRRVSSQIM